MTRNTSSGHPTAEITRPLGSKHSLKPEYTDKDDKYPVMQVIIEYVRAMALGANCSRSFHSSHRGEQTPSFPSTQFHAWEP